MKKIILSLSASLFLLAACNQSNKPSNELELAADLIGDKTIVAQINGKDIYQSELVSYTKLRTEQDFNTMNIEVQKQLFDEFIQLEVLSHKALSLDLQKSDEYRFQIHNVKKNLLAQALLMQYEEINPLGENDIQAEYVNAKLEFEVPEINTSHILVKTLDEANNIIKLLNAKGDFSELAKEHSIDQSAAKGGELGWVSPTYMVKPFADAMIEMANETFSKTPVETQFGFHIIKKEGERIGEAPALENLRPRLEQQIKQRRLQEYLDMISTELDVQELFNPKAPNNTELKPSALSSHEKDAAVK